MNYININESKCKSCYLCVAACPKGLIKKGDKTGKTGEFIVLFNDKDHECLGCKRCALVCPDLAIDGVFKE